jgi:hypothetical protein
VCVCVCACVNGVGDGWNCIFVLVYKTVYQVVSKCKLRVVPLVCSIDIYKSWSNRSLVCVCGVCGVGGVGDNVFDMCLEVVSNLLYAYVVNVANNDVIITLVRVLFVFCCIPMSSNVDWTNQPAALMSNRLENITIEISVVCVWCVCKCAKV